jgi:hypothetical protein
LIGETSKGEIPMSTRARFVVCAGIAAMTSWGVSPGHASAHTVDSLPVNRWVRIEVKPFQERRGGGGQALA